MTLKIIFFPFKLILARLLGSLLAVLSIAILLYCSGSFLEANSSLFTSATGSRFFVNLFPSVGAIYCSVFPGKSCQTQYLQKSNSKDEIGRIANTLSTTTAKASDVFESISHLSNPTNLEIYQTEIWELTFAIRYSSNLEEKDAMAEELWELGGMTGKLKDRVIDLNGKAINSFSSIAHEFSRVGQVIQLVNNRKTSYSIDIVQNNLQLAFSNFDWELKKLIDSIEDSIPLASRAASLGLQVSERIHKEHYKLQLFQDDQPLWRKLIDQTKRSGKQLRRDLNLTARSIQTARALHTGLEEIRSDLVSYQNHVSYFKAAISGWHLADHGLTAEDELESMKSTINQLRDTISMAKKNSKEKDIRIPSVDL
ncbi:uncharacterized protein PGTG_05444 [Puccinia graminis f. sp. tritici CRL 75-36-700-3]|uniref:Uncharacterized protein n=1 Tax=Puccinia graminis f. sp. tritici (strain CRL 75-36-700-3 / race SCCL) TaxID=418459 RepID=E3K4B3_PUCGT|nr:uncharacterized protein PGTG_05444 [Puccinia graminis f. sp. tritici CRL 75-36-700-3]EFP79123.2 hypothetical protein PGTG_05444 [Puccinia graminis f. sp. tritici CRL 75-36-700-3]